MRLHLRQMMAAVAATAWVALNARIFASMDADLPPGDAGRIWAARFLALAVSPTLGAIASWFLWRTSSDLSLWWGRPVLRGALSGAAGGGVAWFVATIILCVGHAANGQTPPVAMIIGVAGAALHMIVGAALAILLGKAPAPPGERRGMGPLPDFLQSADDPPAEHRRNEGGPSQA